MTSNEVTLIFFKIPNAGIQCISMSARKWLPFWGLSGLYTAVNIRPKFHLARHVTSRHVRHVERVETIVVSRAVATWRMTNKL